MTLVAFTYLDVISTCAQVASLLVVLAAAVAAIVQLRHLRASNELEALLTLTAQLRDPHMQRALHFVQTQLEARLGEPDYRHQLARVGFVDAELHPEMEVCNWFNEVGALVKNHLIDEGTFLDLFARLVIYYWSRLTPVVAILRRERGVGQYENFEYLAQLASVWKSKHPQGSYPQNLARLPIEDRWLTLDAESNSP
jgi:hypothetical protein